MVLSPLFLVLVLRLLWSVNVDFFTFKFYIMRFSRRGRRGRSRGRRGRSRSRSSRSYFVSRGGIRL